ncbi:MAG: tRNA (adenosine(37)-N6)-threonylcarbamoyltransferase complex ATPase subunit type 1 TsaE [Oscillospiraceae bacterium]|nr:tRNA (adenosine(37)-N6)-threonylcarbamoyltransferase complex ATPase subunit type 1 TsaE [Oscillospiraceae bacterium]
MTTFETHSPAETEKIGEIVAERLLPGDIVGFTGGLGMGKTVFTRGLAKGLGFDGDVSSPTFSLIHEYRGGKIPLCHMDAYRLTGPDDLFETGFYDYESDGWVIAVEWNERVELEPAVRVEIERIDDNSRRIKLEGRGF